MNVTGECDSKGKITLRFASLSPMESFHLGSLAALFEARKVPLSVRSPREGEVTLQFEHEGFEPGLVGEPTLPFTVKDDSH
jgi:hypothetical protein